MTKINAFTAVTTLIDTDEFVLARSGTTKKVAAANLPGFEISYVEFTSPVSITATTEATANTVVTAGAFTADGVNAYLIEFYSPLVAPSNAGAGRIISVCLFEDGTTLGDLADAFNPVNGVQGGVPMYLARRKIPAAGSRTYSIRAFVSVGTGSVQGGPGGAAQYVPGFIRITRA